MNINDTFNRANQAPVAGSSDGTWSWNSGSVETASGLGNHVDVVSNQAKQQSAGSAVSLRAEVSLANNDNYAQMAIVTRGTGDGCGVCCRETAAGVDPAYYIAYLLEASANVRLYKNTGGIAFTQLGSDTAVTIALPQAIRVQAIGTTIKCFYAGVEKISVTDSAITTGTRTGMRVGSGGSTPRIVDDFRAGDAPEVTAAAGRSFGAVIG